MHNQISSIDGNVLALDISLNKQRFTLVNIYGPCDTPGFFSTTGINFRNKWGMHHIGANGMCKCFPPTDISLLGVVAIYYYYYLFITSRRDIGTYSFVLSF